MNILLVGINAKYIHSNPAIYSLAAYAGKYADAKGLSLREHINIAEYTINQQVEDIEADIYKKMPDVLAVSCYIWNFSMVQELIEDIHQVLPDLHIWLGGPEVSFHPEQLMQKFPFLAGIMIGEGEQTFVELVQRYIMESQNNGVSGDGDNAKPSDMNNIAGLYLPSGYTEERECLDLDEIPFLYSDLTDFENRIIYYESSRGCPFRCKYCLSSIDKQLRFRNLDLVKKELQFFFDKKRSPFRCNFAKMSQRLLGAGFCLGLIGLFMPPLLGIVMTCTRQPASSRNRLRILVRNTIKSRAFPLLFARIFCCF